MPKNRTPTTETPRSAIDGCKAAVEISQAVAKLGWRTSITGADAASANFLKALGLNETARPGSDGAAVVDGQTLARAGNTFTADRGLEITDSAARAVVCSAPVGIAACMTTPRTAVPTAPPAYLLMFGSEEAIPSCALGTSEIALVVTASSVLVTVTDDGRGIGERPPERSFGLVGMEERAHSVGGRLRLSSYPGHGTRVEAYLPYGDGPA